LRLGQCSVDELYQARLVLEPAVARLAVERAGAVLTERLGENVARTEQALDDGRSVSALNREFHAILADVAGNRVLAVMMHALQELLENLDQRFPNAPDVSRCAFDEHREIVAAVRAADGPQTEALMRGHLQRLQGHVRRAEAALTPPAQDPPLMNGSARPPAGAGRAAPLSNPS
jgi:DNA-binding FadR family transcriptional regulator